MFAILFTDQMDGFYQNILSFPTVIFSILLVVCVLFWLVAILGFLDISFLDLPDIDGDLSGSDVSASSDGPSTPDAVAGIILKLGLNGVPLTVVISLITIFSWLISYYSINFVRDIVSSGPLYYIAGLFILFVALYLSALITAKIISPLRPMFKKMEQDIEKQVLGQTAEVRTSRVDTHFGEAILDDGGAGLILKVRAINEEKFTKGDKVVLIEYLKESNAFRVVSEQEFRE